MLRLDDRERIQHEPHVTAPAIKFPCAASFGSVDVDDCLCAHRKIARAGKRAAELVEAREVERDAGHVPEQGRHHTTPQPTYALAPRDVACGAKDKRRGGYWERAEARLLEVVGLLNARLEQVDEESTDATF